MSALRTSLRDRLAAGMRSLPTVRGRARIGGYAQALLTDYARDEECLVTSSMSDGSTMELDLRSLTERWAFWTGSYDRFWMRFFRDVLPSNAVVLDVGANIGFYAVPLGLHLRSGRGRVFAFEPEAANYRRLLSNVRRNGLEGVVVPFPLALGDHQGRVVMNVVRLNGATSGNAVVKPPGSVSEMDPTVELTTLDSFAQSHRLERCDLIKADIEGCEYLLLRGAQQLLSVHRPLILCELNHHWMNESGWSLDDVRKLISSMDYALYQEGERGGLTPYRPQDLPIEQVLFVPRSSTALSAGPLAARLHSERTSIRSALYRRLFQSK